MKWKCVYRTIKWLDGDISIKMHQRFTELQSCVTKLTWRGNEWFQTPAGTATPGWSASWPQWDSSGPRSGELQGSGLKSTNTHTHINTHDFSIFSHHLTLNTPTLWTNVSHHHTQTTQIHTHPMRKQAVASSIKPTGHTVSANNQRAVTVKVYFTKLQNRQTNIILWANWGARLRLMSRGKLPTCASEHACVQVPPEPKSTFGLQIKILWTNSTGWGEQQRDLLSRERILSSLSGYLLPDVHFLKCFLVMNTVFFQVANGFSLFECSMKKSS